MKKYIFFFITVLILVFLSACIQQEINSLSLPEKNKIIKAYYITENGYKSTTDKENINNLLFELSLVNIKSFDSLQDTPRVDEYSEINFELSTGTSSNKVFVYKTQEVFFLEQPYNGIFTIDEIQYQSIVAIFDD